MKLTDILQLLYVWVMTYVSIAWAFLNQNFVAVAIVGVLIYLARKWLLWPLFVLNHLYKQWWVGVMARRERDLLVRQIISDGLTELMEDAAYKDKLTNEEKTIWYRRFGKLLGLNDLLQRHEKALKEEIAERLGTHDPVKLPDARLSMKNIVSMAHRKTKTT